MPTAPRWKSTSQYNQSAAEWRLRTQRRGAIYDRLESSFPDGLGVLTQGSLLVGLDRMGMASRLESHSRYRDTIRSSTIYKSITERAGRLLLKLDKPVYQRLEDAFAAFGSGILLAAGQCTEVTTERRDLRIAVNDLKVWVVEHGVRNSDQVIAYLKWLIKCVQCCLLNNPVPSGESFFPGYNFKKKKLLKTPFKGPLLFIEDLLLEKRPRSAGLRLEEARAMAQIASQSRALPFPSLRNVIESVNKTLTLITTPGKVMTENDVHLYEGGIARTFQTLGPYQGKVTHSSLTNSGSVERSQSEGGRAAEMVTHIRSLTDLEVTVELINQITDLVDCFGEPVMPPATAVVVKEFILRKDLVVQPSMGDVLYFPVHEIQKNLDRTQTGYRVPKFLGNIAAMVSSAMVTEFGHYSVNPKVDLPGMLLLFERGKDVVFIPEITEITVKAALSEEGGGKTRLVTAAPAALTQLGQLVRHHVADDLRRDPFLRVGFDEADKLWETLSSYRKLSPSKSKVSNSDSFLVSLDLEEATYNMPHQLLEINHKWMDRRYGEVPAWRVFSRLFAVYKRRIDLSSVRAKGQDGGLWPSDPVSVRGSFMGDSLSFMHLTMMVSSCVWQASAVAHFKSVANRPNLKYFEGYIARPLGQAVGDDAIILGAPGQFVHEFKERLTSCGAKMSKIDAACADVATFCENWLVRPIDDNDANRAIYPVDSLFGDIWFLDTIKGSLLSGHAKVKADGADPFIGQARMLSKQIAWHPIRWMRFAVPIVLWARNFSSARFLGNINPHLPISLGGLEIAIGPMDPIEDPRMAANYAAYLEAILELPIEEFLEWQMLLTGITRSNPKGVPWENDPVRIALLVSQVELIAESNVLSDIPDYISRKGRGDIQRFMEETLGLTSVRFLTDLMTRLEAFKAFWDGKAAAQPFLSISCRKLRPRFKSVWTRIRERVKPKEVSELKCKSWTELGKKFDSRTWGLLFSNSDPAIEEIYDGMSTLTVRWGRLGALASS